MIRKLIIILFSAVFVHAGIIGTDYSPATSVSYSSFSSSPVFTKTIETPIVKTIAQPIEYAIDRPELSPIYESILNTHENKFMTADGSEHRTFSKSLNTGNSKINKFEARSTNDGISYGAVSSPIYTEAIYKSGSQQSISPIPALSTLLKPPVTYTVQSKPLNYITSVPKSLPTYSIGTSPIIYNTKVTPGLSAYASPSVEYTKSYSSSEYQPKTAITYYSEPPVVSHVTFSGSGGDYSW